MHHKRIGCWLLLSLSLGCSDGVAEASSITYTRVLGVRVEVEGDAERATPSVSEGATARVLVMGPNGVTDVAYAMDVCAAMPETGGLPACAGASLTAVAPAAPSAEPTLQWPGFTSEQVGDADALLVRGTICEEGTPELDATRPGQCVDPSFVGVSFINRVPLLADGQAPNRHPSLAAATLRIDDVTWDADECGAIASRDGKEHTLSITLHDAHRETLDGEAETLLLSWFANAGELDVHFSVLEAEQAEDMSLEVAWTAPPADAEAIQDTATITLVLRDQRGGVDWITRTICVQ